MSISWDFPYPSQRMPVCARNLVVTSQPLAAQAGLRMLLAGGNAVDAAVATAIALTIIEPINNGIGSDCFAIVWDGQRLHGLNGSGRSPKAMSPERFAGRESIPPFGWDAVTVPGCVDAWAALSKRFGKLPFPKLFEPAIDYAERGFSVAPRTAWGGLMLTYQQFEPFQATFAPGGRAPGPGELFRAPDHARSLRDIAETRGESFYRGALAEQIVAHSNVTGGLMQADDLAGHRSEWVEPISTEYHGVRLHEIPPNGQGIAALIALAILRHHDVRQYAPDSADSIHLQIEAMKIGFSEAQRHVADPRFMQVTPEDLLDEGFIAERAKGIRTDRAGDPRAAIDAGKDTVYLTAADESGMMVSLIQSNYWGFGSGVVVPGTGISFQNRGWGFSLKPGHPNQIAGGKRPYHTIIPAFVTRDGKPLMSFGVVGGHFQPQGHLQMVVRMVDYGQNPQAALDAPRWSLAEDYRRVGLEPGCKPDVADELRRRGHDVSHPAPGFQFGGGQIIYRLDDGYVGASEPRKDGQAVGF